MIHSPSSQEHIFGITHHFEDGSKLLFTFIDRKLFFKAPVSRRAPRQAAPAPSGAGAALWARKLCLPRTRPLLSCRICLEVKQDFSPLCKGSSFLNVFPVFLKRKTIYWSVRGSSPLKFFKVCRALPDFLCPALAMR